MLLSSPVGQPPAFLRGLGAPTCGPGQTYRSDVTFANVTGQCVTDAQYAECKSKGTVYGQPCAVSATALGRLQIALTALSKATRNTSIDPGAVDGKLTNGMVPDRTMAAVAAAIALIGPKLGTYKRAALQIALGIGATTSEAKGLVLSYANELTYAVQAATIAAPYYVKPEEPGATDSSSSGASYQPSGPWYKTWWGIGAIGVGVLGVMSLLLSARGSGGVSGLMGYSRYRVRVSGRKGKGSLCVSAQSRADAKDMVRGNLKKGQRVTRVEHGC